MSDKGDAGHRPARGYSRPPFAEGNLVAIRHGARSPRKVAALAEQLAAGLLGDLPDVAPFPEAVAAWSRAEARCALLDEWITDHGLLDENGELTTGAAKYIAAWEGQAATARQRLGLDPRAEAELARERVDARRSVIDLEAIAARGREVVAVRRAELAGPETAVADAGVSRGPGGRYVNASDALARLAGTVAGALVLGLIRDDGRPWGSSAAAFQLDDAAAVLDTDSATPLHFLTRPRGGSKTSDLAAVAIGVLVAQAPPRSRSYAVAADAEQAGQLLDALGGYVARTPELAAALNVETWKVTNPATGATLAILPADASSAFGLRPHLVIADEVAQWAATRNSKRVWEAVVSSLPKVPGSRLVVLTSAGDPAHWSHKVLTGARSSPRWRVHEVAGPVPWIDPAALAEQRNLLTESQYARLHLNRWTSAEDRLVTDEDLRACIVLDGPQPPTPGTRYVVGVDLGLKSDRTVIAVCHREVEAPRRIVLDRMLTFTGTRLTPVRLADVEAAMVEVQATYRPAVIADPWQAVGLMQRLRGHGLTIDEFTFGAQSVGRLASVLFRVLRDHELALPDDPELIAELGNVRLRENSVGALRIDHDAGQHDDRVISLALAVQALTEQAGGRAFVSVPQGVIPRPFRPATSFAEQLAAAVTPWDHPRDAWPGRSNVWPARQKW